MRRAYRSWWPALIPALALAAVLAACGSQAAPPAPGVRALVVSAPATIPAGTPLTVTVGAAGAADGLPVRLLATGSYGARVYEAPVQDGQAQFALPADSLRARGQMTLTAAAGAVRGVAQVEVQPGAAVDPVLPLVGARSIIADAEHWSMLVTVPTDSYDNPVAEGTVVQANIEHPDGIRDYPVIRVQHLLAWVRIFSRIQAGRTTIAVAAGGAHGPDTTLLEVAGWPMPFTLSATPPTLPADGRQLITLRTAIIRDRYGNMLPDGILVTFVVTTPAGDQRNLPAYTIGGIAEAPLQAATAPGTFVIYATVYNVESRPLEVVFTPGPAVGAFPLRAQVDAVTRTIQIDAGPVLGALDQYVPDGTRVRIGLTDPTGNRQWLTAPTVAGMAHIEIRLTEVPLGTYSAEADAGTGRGVLTFSVP